MSKQDSGRPAIIPPDLEITRKQLLKLASISTVAEFFTTRNACEEYEIVKRQEDIVSKITKEFIKEDYFNHYGIKFSDPDQREIEIATMNNGKYWIESSGETGPKINSYQALGLNAVNIYNSNGSLSSSKISINCLFGGQFVPELSSHLFKLGKEGINISVDDLEDFARAFFNLSKKLKWNKYIGIAEEDGSQRVIIDSVKKLSDGRIINIIVTSYGELSLSIINPQNPASESFS